MQEKIGRLYCSILEQKSYSSGTAFEKEALRIPNELKKSKKLDSGISYPTI
ncbi:hypothetical protein [Methanosarcina sp. 2.H.A.1B.4]|uniref:hypothetical protein n=1 Tax=Methanosarcina sp. 2.H.A.1B.4 TaxID=1483600 RepID=UPI000A977E00|nr:hypothetical protein [Methanosarcina sp. 2.H.A.1B.4]